METASACSKYRDVRLLHLIPNASFLSPTWGRGGRPQTSKGKNEWKSKRPQPSLHFKGCESGSSCTGENLNHCLDWFFKLDSSLEVYRSCALWRDRNGRFRPAWLKVRTEEITSSKLCLMDLRWFDTYILNAVPCMCSIGALSYWVRPGLRIGLGPFILSLNSHLLSTFCALDRAMNQSYKGPVLWQVKFRAPVWFWKTPSTFSSLRFLMATCSHILSPPPTNWLLRILEIKYNRTIRDVAIVLGFWCFV